jgi:hypothetical protein
VLEAWARSTKWGSALDGCIVEWVNERGAAPSDSKGKAAELNQGA